MDDLQQKPRPPESKALEVSETLRREILDTWEPRSARLDEWRVVYAVNEDDREVAVLLVARRPPYRYENLEQLLKELEGPG